MRVGLAEKTVRMSARCSVLLPLYIIITLSYFLSISLFFFFPLPQDENRSDETTSFCHTSKMELRNVSEAEQLVIKRQLYTQDTLQHTYSNTRQPRTLCDVIKGCTRRVSPRCVGRRALDFLPIVKYVWQ